MSRHTQAHNRGGQGGAATTRTQAKFNGARRRGRYNRTPEHECPPTQTIEPSRAHNIYIRVDWREINTIRGWSIYFTSGNFPPEQCDARGEETWNSGRARVGQVKLRARARMGQAPDFALPLFLSPWIALYRREISSVK